MSDLIAHQTRQKNQRKLIEQNTHLHTQLTRLQKEIELLEEKTNTQRPQQPQLTELRGQIEHQEREMRQLKEAVETGRQSKTKENVYYIKKEEDELLWMKGQLQNLSKEREVLAQSHQGKLRKLSENQPLLKHKQQLQREWNETKRENREKALKMVEIEREIRRLHALKESSKDVNSPPVNEEVELATVQSQIGRMVLEMRSKELRWKPNGQVLDKEFFSSRNTLQTMAKKVEELDKEEGIWRLRAAALRDKGEILTDRERLSKVVAMAKPEPIIKLPLTPKEVAKKPMTMEQLMQREMKDIPIKDVPIKEAPATQMVRASSTPLNNLKKVQPKQAEVITKKMSSEHIKGKNGSVRASKEPIDERVGFKKAESMKSPLKSPKEEGKSIKSDEIMQQNKNGSIWLGRRQKIKSKKANPVGLAEAIQQKADEVKKINRNLQKEEERERSVSSPKKHRIGKSSDRLETNPRLDETTPRNNKVVNAKNTPLVQQKRIELANIKQTDKPPSNRPKYQKQEPLNKEGKKLNLVKLNKAVNLNESTKRQRTLVEKIDLTSKAEPTPTKPAKKTKEMHKPSPQPEQKQASPRPSKAVRQQKSKQTKPLLAQQKQEPIFQIFMSDKTSKIGLILPSSQKASSNLDDETDGIPKLIVRKRASQGVATGTST